MKKNIVNVLATTGMSLLLLSAAALLSHAKCIYLETVFQVFFINVITHWGMILMKKISFKNVFIEMVSEIIFTVCGIVVFGLLFDWFSYIRFTVLILMGAAVYIISFFLDLLQMKQEANEINMLIVKRNRTRENSDPAR